MEAAEAEAELAALTSAKKYRRRSAATQLEIGGQKLESWLGELRRKG